MGSPSSPGAGDRIGPYRIVDVLGEGGMGTVYLAEQSEHIARYVALKVIKLGMDSRAVVARFEAERQALALMEHDNIARIYDGGLTDRGQPFFTMEVVDGQRITDYSDEHRLDLTARLALFLQVCAAVQHAHDKGVVHRDLAPNNVLVANRDGSPQVKIIDFGLARAVERRLTDKTFFTEQGQFLGTPEYMSPEQAGVGGDTIDRRSDVYTLGVLLYELLAGDLPFDSVALRGSGMLEMQRVIREVRPPKPSVRISRHTGSDVGLRLAESRRIDLAGLRRRLRGNLDSIVIRALEKRRERRYPTVAALADDVRRHLEGRAIVGQPERSPWQCMFGSRRKAFTATGIVLVLAVSAFVAWQVSTDRVFDREIQSDPVGAEVYVDNVLVGVTPQFVRFDFRDRDIVVMRLSAPGFLPVVTEFEIADVRTRVEPIRYALRVQ